METGLQRYLEEVQRQLPVLEAFNGFQPSYHLNDIAIRHWDGYWFGKREMFGDTFPHYWSTITAVAFIIMLCVQAYLPIVHGLKTSLRITFVFFSEDDVPLVLIFILIKSMDKGAIL